MPPDFGGTMVVIINFATLAMTAIIRICYSVEEMTAAPIRLDTYQRNRQAYELIDSKQL
jgi:hypothetical protein